MVGILEQKVLKSPEITAVFMGSYIGGKKRQNLEFGGIIPGDRTQRARIMRRITTGLARVRVGIRWA